jgi:hypothetical protein
MAVNAFAPDCGKISRRWGLNGKGASMFSDRDQAGRELARRLLAMRDEAPVVLALPRSGGGDPETEVAELCNGSPGLVAIPIGRSSKLRVGDYAVAIGDPFG